MFQTPKLPATTLQYTLCHDTLTFVTIRVYLQCTELSDEAQQAGQPCLYEPVPPMAARESHLQQHYPRVVHFSNIFNCAFH